LGFLTNYPGKLETSSGKAALFIIHIVLFHGCVLYVEIDSFTERRFLWTRWCDFG
jgi:hypothetical protein